MLHQNALNPQGDNGTTATYKYFAASQTGDESIVSTADRPHQTIFLGFGYAEVGKGASGDTPTVDSSEGTRPHREAERVEGQQTRRAKLWRHFLRRFPRI